MENQQPTGEAQNSQKKEWYKNWWGVILIIMLLPFFAIWYIWTKTKWNKAVKGIATLAVIIISIMAISSDNSEENKNQYPANNQQQEQTKQTATTTPVQETKNEEVKNEQPVEPFNIDVSSQIVKKTDGKHRYFFDIRNNDKKDFNGSVSITLYNDKQSSALGGNTFTSSSAIKPKLGDSVYIDINTGPVSVHGEYGITKFKYEVKIDNKVVKSGEGKITSKYEDLSSFSR